MPLLWKVVAWKVITPAKAGAEIQFFSYWGNNATVQELTMGSLHPNNLSILLEVIPKPALMTKMRTFGVWQGGRNRHSHSYSDAGPLGAGRRCPDDKRAICRPNEVLGWLLNRTSSNLSVWELAVNRKSANPFPKGLTSRDALKRIHKRRTFLQIFLKKCEKPPKIANKRIPETTANVT